MCCKCLKEEVQCMNVFCWHHGRITASSMVDTFSTDFLYCLTHRHICEYLLTFSYYHKEQYTCNLGPINLIKCFSSYFIQRIGGQYLFYVLFSFPPFQLPFNFFILRRDAAFSTTNTSLKIYHLAYDYFTQIYWNQFCLLLCAFTSYYSKY